MKLKLNIQHILILGAFVFGLIGQYGFTQTATKTLRVLFIGNSYTYYHSMPQLFKAMAINRFSDDQFEVKFIGGGGVTLKQHWEENLALQATKTGRWDYVVLQEQSMLGSAVIEDGRSYVGRPDQFFKYARMFVKAIKQQGAEPVFYMTWSRKNSRDQQKYLTYAYMTIAKELNSKIAPVGLVWDKVKGNSDVNLYEKDGSHPSVSGSYLAATTLFATIFDTAPTGVPGYLEGYEILRGGKVAKEKSTLCNLPRTTVKMIQDSVVVVFKKAQENGGYLEIEKAVSDKEPSRFSVIFMYVRNARSQAVIFIIIIVILLITKVSKKEDS